jgi:hypothetical protein
MSERAYLIGITSILTQVFMLAPINGFIFSQYPQQRTIANNNQSLNSDTARPVVHAGWNLLFPTACSEAFTYQGYHIKRDTLHDELILRENDKNKSPNWFNTHWDFLLYM